MPYQKMKNGKYKVKEGKMKGKEISKQQMQAIEISKHGKGKKKKGKK